MGLGSLIAFVWGWQDTLQTDQGSWQKRDETKSRMQWWSGSLIVQVMILGYLWYHAPEQPAPSVISSPAAQSAPSGNYGSKPKRYTGLSDSERRSIGVGAALLIDGDYRSNPTAPTLNPRDSRGYDID